MARPSKCRRVCRMPRCREFVSLGGPGDTENGLMLSVEEYETLRLIDHAGMTQEACASQMNASRTTIQSLYASARRKLARFVVEGGRLRIEGGHFEICGRDCVQFGQSHLKGDRHMKIAVTYENGQVFQHFGHTQAFKIYTAQDGKVTASEVEDTNGSGHGALAGFLKERGVDVLICGGIGAGAKNALAEAGIQLYAGACGDADAQVASFLEGNLTYDPDTECHHHDHEDGHHCHGHEGGHGCGGHGSCH